MLSLSLFYLFLIILFETLWLQLILGKRQIFSYIWFYSFLFILFILNMAASHISSIFSSRIMEIHIHSTSSYHSTVLGYVSSCCRAGKWGDNLILELVSFELILTVWGNLLLVALCGTSNDFAPYSQFAGLFFTIDAITDIPLISNKDTPLPF